MIEANPTQDPESSLIRIDEGAGVLTFSLTALVDPATGTGGGVPSPGEHESRAPGPDRERVRHHGHRLLLTRSPPALWAALRLLDETVNLAHRLADDSQAPASSSFWAWINGARDLSILGFQKRQDHPQHLTRLRQSVAPQEMTRSLLSPRSSTSIGGRSPMTDIHPQASIDRGDLDTDPRLIPPSVALVGRQARIGRAIRHRGAEASASLTFTHHSGFLLPDSPANTGTATTVAGSNTPSISPCPYQRNGNRRL